MQGFLTLFRKELVRFWKVSFQTVAAPVLTALLYQLIFAHVLSQHVEAYPGVSYSAFLIPGLAMMSMAQNAFANSSSSLIQSKVNGSLTFVLVAPLSSLEMFLAYVGAAVVRGTLVGLGLYLAVLGIVQLPVFNLAAIIAFTLLASATLGAMGLIAAIWAMHFEQLSAFQNFIVVPLSFLSGVFYSIHTLPPFWHEVSRWNPFFYMIDGFRYGFFGQSDAPPGLSLAVCAVFFAAVSVSSIVMLRSGYKVRH